MKNIKFIAEVGSNHNCDLERALLFVKRSAEIGCWGVKFQLFEAEKLFHPDFKKQIELFKKCEMPRSFVKRIHAECVSNGIKFICTPFDLDAVSFLEPYVDYYKIGSYESHWDMLLAEILETGKPWFISTGMDTVGLYDALTRTDFDLKPNEIKRMPTAVFHCNSNYPAAPANCNLRKMKKSKNGVGIGWSDHTVSPGVLYAAIAQGAEYIEFHVDFDDMHGFESHHGHCWNFEDVLKIIENVRDWRRAMFDNDTMEHEPSKWMTDPLDGLRPLNKYRKELLNENK